MAALTATKVAIAGVTPAPVACAGGGDTVPCGDNIFLRFKNTDGTPKTVTIDYKQNTSPVGTTIPDPTVVVPATTGEKVFGPVSGAYFADPVTGRCSLSYSGVTGLTVEVWAL